MKQQLLTQSDYAKYRNVSRQRVGQWISAGRIELVNGRIDARAADRSLEETQIPTMNERKSPTVPLSQDDDAHDIKMTVLWANFWQSLRQLWWELRKGSLADRKLRREHLVNTVRRLK